MTFTARTSMVLGVVSGLACAASGVLAAQYPACSNRGGRPVAMIPSDSLPFAAWATLTDSGESVIYWNAGRMVTASSPARLLVYLHECAHHFLGHVQKLPSNDAKLEFERQADCWAVQKMVDEELISPVALHETLNEIGQWVGDRTHRGGTSLVETLGRCLTDRTSAPLWRQFLDGLTFASIDSLAPIRGELIPESEDELISESIMDAPGAFDCDIRGGHVLLCRLFQGVRTRTVERRYQAIRSIFLEWLAPPWRSEERKQEGFHQPLIFMAWNEETGSNLALVMTETQQLFLTWSAIRP